MLFEKKNVIFKNIKANEEFKDEDGEIIPKHETLLELTEDQQEKITKEILLEKEAIDEEWNDLGILTKISMLRKQYAGELVFSSYDEFMEVESGITKDRCRALANRIYRTISSTDPFFNVSTRPGYLASQEDAEDLTQSQEDFIDYACDERVNIKRILKRAISDATIVDLVFLKFIFDVVTEKKTKKERFASNPEWTIMYQAAEGPQKVILNDIDLFKSAEAKIKKMNYEYRVEYTNPGLEALMRSYSDAEMKDLEQYAEDLYEGRDVEVEVDYDEVIRSDPKTEMVKVENVRFRSYCDTYDDLADTKLFVEIKEYTYHELKKLEEQNRFFGVDKLFTDEDGKLDTNHKKEKYDILECTYFVNIDDIEEDAESDTSEQVKCVFWINEEKKLMIGSELYSIDEVKCAYVPLKIRNEDNGLLSIDSPASDITAEDVSSTMILRFMLEAWYFKNTITPITENQGVIDDFLERRWTHGMPMEAKKGEIDFLGNYITPPNIREGLELMAVNRKIAENKIGVTSGMSGDADPVDPGAPASKTIALLQNQKPDLLSYIENISQAINTCGYIIIAMYAQLTEESIPYKVRPSRVSKYGGQFANITKADLMAKTNIQTQAYAFAVDELMLKRELIAFYQMIRMEPLFAQDPKNVNLLLRAIGKAWNPQIRNKIDEILPTTEELDMRKAQAALNGVMQYVKMALVNAKTKNQEPEIDPRMLLQVVTEHIKDLATQPTKEEAEQRRQRDEAILTKG